MSKTILITGASSGIGKEASNYFLKKGYNVIGVSRKTPENINFPYFECDLVDKAQISKTIKDIKTKYKSIDILINCAGVGTGGAIEEVTIEDLKWVFEVNLFGLLEFTKNVIPLLKESNNAKIINIGSVAGEITVPFQTSYSMSKSSLQRLSEGLRIELKPFGIDVCTVLPGDTKTGFTNNRKTVLNEGSLYSERVKRSISKMEKDEQNGVSPLKVVKVIEKVMNKRKTPIQKIVGFDYKLLVFLSRVLPRRLVEKIITRMYG